MSYLDLLAQIQFSDPLCLASWFRTLCSAKSSFKEGLDKSNSKRISLLSVADRWEIRFEFDLSSFRPRRPTAPADRRAKVLTDRADRAAKAIKSTSGTFGKQGEAWGKHRGSWGKQASFGGSTHFAPLNSSGKWGEAMQPSSPFIILNISASSF